MDANEFTSKLEESFNKEVNQSTIAELQEWIYNKHIPEDFLDKLYNRIKEDYRYRIFPSYAYIVKIAGQLFSDLRKKRRENYSDIWRSEKEFKNVDTWELLELLKRIDKKLDSVELSNKENDVYMTFKPLLNDYVFMKNKNWNEQSIYNRLKFLQDKICKYQDVNELWEKDIDKKKIVSDLVSAFLEGKVLKRENPDYFHK